jgi:chemotaxis protein methyltransferase CheR
MLLREMLPDLEAWRISITATDINPQFLEKAVRGEYGSWSFRGVPDAVRARHFRPAGSGRVAIREEVKRMVRFAHLNLAEDRYPSVVSDTNAMDLVLCRNVLIYFAPAQGERVVRKLARALVPDGTLFLGPSEANLATIPGYDVTARPGGIVVRRTQPPASSRASPRAVDDAPLARSRTDSGAKPQAPRPAPVPVAQDFGRRARDCADAGRLHQALEWCDRWVAAEKTQPSAHYLGALVLLELGSSALARAALQRVLYLEPGHVLAHVCLAQLALAAGSGESMRRHLAHARRGLERLDAGDVVPDSDGMTAARLAATLAALDRGSAPEQAA